MRKQTQFVETIQLNNTNVVFPSNLPREKYLFAVHFNFRGRVRVTALATDVLPEGVLNLVRRLRVTMTHDIFKAQIICDMSGPSLYAYNQIYNGVTGRLEVTPLLSVNIGEYDYDFTLSVFFPPELIFPRDQEVYLLDGPRCSRLQAEIDWGSAASAIEGGTTALANFGQTTGNPEVDVEVEQVLDKEGLPHVALVQRLSLEETLAAALTDGRIRDLATGESVRSYMLKQYTRSLTAGQPTSVAATLLDPIENGVDAGLGRVSLRVNERAIRTWRGWQNLRDQNRKNFRLDAVPLGYAMIEFVEEGNIDRVLFTQDYVQRRLRLDLAGDVIAGANNRIEITTTSIKANPNLK